MSIDQTLNDFFAPISEKAFEIVLYSVPIAGQDVKLLLIWLAGAALFFTAYFGFINIRLFPRAIDIIRGKFDNDKDPGQINSWQALMTSMSGTIGLGNIAGVAVAVSLGGPGAVFWMIALGFFSMSTKFVEVTLGVKYRQTITNKDGSVSYSGGPMHYLRNAFDRFNLPILGKALSVIFAICCVLGSIGAAILFQANQSFQQFYNITGGEAGIMAEKGWLFGLGLALLVGVVVVGGIQSIAKVASRLVPFMAAIYIIMALIVIAMNAGNIPWAFGQIISQAFTAEAGFSGVLGAMLVGFQRAAFSNESGMGTAPIVYAATRAKDPIEQGIASMLGPFIDTILICTTTALLILISGAYDPSLTNIEGVALTSRALESGVEWFKYILAFAVFLFAYSTMISFAYISGRCVTYLLGHKEWLDKSYKIFYCSLAIVGASANLGPVIDFTDATFLSMAIPNILGLLLLAPIVKKDLQKYIQKQS